ncbi:MAG: Bax inhibitor-1 family protein [Cellvibrionales bacterium]|nr:Bax inhibitor-1 family protein [Cellvibrionales bacterium]
MNDYPQNRTAAAAHAADATFATGLSPDISKVLRNTYMLLAMTLTVSAGAAMASMAADLSHGTGLIMMLVALVLLFFVLPRTAHSAAGLGVVFAFTALLGGALGPTLNHYLAMDGGSGIVTSALGSTALVFFTLSGYVLVTGKDFSFMRGFLLTGLIVALVSMLGLILASMFGVQSILGAQLSGAFLALNAMIALLMSGFILYDTSRIVNGGETNYVLATVALYLNIYNLFASLLHLFGAANE